MSAQQTEALPSLTDAKKIPFLLFPQLRPVPDISTLLVAIIHRLRLESHIDDFGRLKLPIPALQDPNVLGPRMDAIRLGRIIESVFDPVRKGDAVFFFAIVSYPDRMMR